MALVIARIFHNLHLDMSIFYSRGAFFFFGLLLDSFVSAVEGYFCGKQFDYANIVQMLTFYARRPVIEKHARHALYHPFAEAVSSMIWDLPYQVSMPSHSTYHSIL